MGGETRTVEQVVEVLLQHAYMKQLILKRWEPWDTGEKVLSMGESSITGVESNHQQLTRTLEGIGEGG